MLPILEAPLIVREGKFSFSMNLNTYRNAHYFKLNKSKILFKQAIKLQILSLPEFQNKIAIEYTLYPKTKRLCDVSNICCVVDKYFSDALVELGKLPDDNYLFIDHITYKFGEVDKFHPRVEIKIIPITETIAS